MRYRSATPRLNIDEIWNRLLGLILGVFAILLGLKGFSDEGMPFANTQNIIGTKAKVIGSFCVTVGLIMFLGGMNSVVHVYGGS